MLKFILILALAMPLFAQTGVTTLKIQGCTDCQGTTDLMEHRDVSLRHHVPGGLWIDAGTLQLKWLTTPEPQFAISQSPTWADADGKATLNWCIAQPAPPDAEPQIEAALAEWAKYVQVTFARGTCGGDRTVTFSLVPRDHGDGYPFHANELSHAFYPPPLFSEPLAGDVHINQDSDYDLAAPLAIYRLVLHEIGHALGLMDSDNPGVMYRYMLPSGPVWLQQGDIDAARRLYGRRCRGIECAWGLNR
jgi:hypothetical protein